MIKLLSIVMLVLASRLAEAQLRCTIIPKPNSVVETPGEFLLNRDTRIIFDTPDLGSSASYLQRELLRTRQLPLIAGATTNRPSIRLSYDKKKGAPGSYSLNIRPSEVMIRAGEPEGLFYGIISFLQIISQAQMNNGSYILTGLSIEDKPAMSWRGIMLDESRHFFGVKKIKSLLDWMAFYKLNRFHWHLTDEPAWRLEIKKYPRLSLIGGVGNYLDETAPAQYYTQEQIKEIVSYAAERFITVIPEIDMPGHATAANRAYPEHSGGGSHEHPDFTFHPGKNETYSYLSDILSEVNVLFPSGMMHLGGDEVSFGNQKWASDSAVVTLMKLNNLSSMKQVETYFMKRMADSVYKMNSRLLVWDEMAEAGLPKDKTVLFWWRHDKPEQLKTSIENGYPVVICPRLPFYFDFVQDSTHTYGRKWGGAYNGIRQVYMFSPDNLRELANARKGQVLGVQANLWTETVQTALRFDYLLFPRIAALAETAWSLEGQKDLDSFMTRLKGHMPLYDEAGLYYYDPFNPGKHPEPVRIGTQKKRFKTED